MTETELQSGLAQCLELNGFLVSRVHSGSKKVGRTWMQFARKGTADYLCCCPNGRYLAMEVKLPGKKRRPEQMEFGRRVAQMGGLSIVVRDVAALNEWLGKTRELWYGQALA